MTIAAIIIYTIIVFIVGVAWGTGLIPLIKQIKRYRHLYTVLRDNVGRGPRPRRIEVTR